jgi:predicted Ser/Thr protein kinase
VGTRLGPYEVLGPLGAGGMGEVYRARDARLGREVALKRLRPELAASEERRKRFEREARAASALNHPHIVSAYDIGDEQGALSIAMELVEGRTLREAVAEEPLPLRKLLDVAVQAASALARAHADGIVHRDLKPENLMLSRDGFLKTLDFGLAKLVEAEHAGSGSELITAVGGTQAGTVLGTVGYMSPEQAAGRAVDFRSDQPLAQAAPRLPAPLRWVIERCLAKDPEERYASTKDLARELETLRRRLPEATGSGETAAVATDVGSDRFPTFQRLTFRRGTVLSARFAPDGQTVYYGATWDGEPCRLFSTRPESPESSALSLPDAEVLAISSTGQMAISLDRHWAGRFIWSGTLAQAPLVGGAPREILEDVQWADWGADGASLAVIRRVEGKCRVECPIGHVLFETAGWASHVRVSPDGGRVAFLHHPTLADDGGAVESVERASGRSLVHSDGWITLYGLAWRSASEIWFTATRVGVARSIWAVPVAGGRERLLARTPGELTIQDVARDGRALITSDNEMVGIIAGRTAEAGERDLSLLDWSLLRDISPDGKLILFDESGEGGGAVHSVYVRRTDGSPAVRLGAGVGGSLSPDGRSVMAQTSDHAWHLLPLSGGPPQPASGLGPDDRLVAFTPDGAAVYGFRRGELPGRLFELDLATGLREVRRELQPRDPSGVVEIVSVVATPDGASYAYSQQRILSDLFLVEGLR